MELTTQEKQLLKEMRETQGYRILKRIEKEEEDVLFRRLATFDIDNERDREEIKKWQIYQRARNDFFQNTEHHLKEIYVPNNNFLDS